MSSRWLWMLMLFTLGFGSACLVQVGKAQDSGGEQWFDGDFLVEDGEVLKLDNRSREKGYLTLVDWKPGADASGGSIKVATGLVTVPTADVDSVTIYRLQAVARWEAGIFRPCDPPDIHDCPIPSPIPPPPPEGYAHPPQP